MSTEAAIGRRAVGRLWKQALVVGLSFGGVAASSAISYASTYPTVADRARVAAGLQGNAGFSVLFGQVDALGSIGGYTAYKGFVFLTTIAAIWASLAVTRLLRGEEDAGRWAIVLAGRTTASRATAGTMFGVAVALAGSLVVAVVLVALTATDPKLGFGSVDAVWFGASLAIPAFVFAAAAGVAAQLARTRRLASWIVLGVFAVAFVVRMVADAGTGSHWLLWATPLGWAELVHPFTRNDPWPLVPAVIATVALGGLAIWLADRRDVGGGTLAMHDTSALRPFGLGSTLGLAVRLDRAVLAAWAVGVAASGFVMGLVAKAATEGLTSSDSAGNMLSKLGASGAGVDQYLGVVFLLVGSVLALVPASQVAAAREEEASGRLAFVLAGPVGRSRWLTERLAIAAVAIVAIGAVSALGTWAGAASQGIRVDVGSLFIAGLNIVPSALLALSLGALALSVVPRAAAVVVYVVVIWSIAIDLLGSLVTGLGPLTRLSLFHYMTLAPAQDPDLVALAVITVLALTVAAGAVALFARRDLRTD